jgi:HSP20 family protein
MAIERWQPWSLRPWRPFRDFEEMERWMEEALRPGVPAVWWRTPTAEMAWLPAFEMYEKPDKFVVRVDLPGMKKEEIDVHVVGDTLTVSGERRESTEVKNEEYRRCEFNYGSFSRSITLPAAVNAARVDASFENGVLEITLPKAVEVKPKKVQVKGKETKALGSKARTTEAKTK